MPTFIQLPWIFAIFLHVTALLFAAFNIIILPEHFLQIQANNT